MAQQRTYYVYIMASKSRVLYIGVTGFLMQRVLQHRAGEGGEFTRRYRVHRRVYFQSFHNVGDAIARETELKKWRRDKKIALIEERNPTWEDLAEGWGGPAVMRVGKDSRFLPSVGMTTPNPLSFRNALSFRNGVAVEESAVAWQRHGAGRKQIPPFGRNDNT